MIPVGYALVFWAVLVVLCVPFTGTTIMYARADDEPVVVPAPVVDVAPAFAPAPVAPVAPVAPEKKETIRQQVERIAAKYDVDAVALYKTLDCESAHFASPSIQSRHIINGKRERSFGYAQIHLRDHPDVSYEQAIDPEFAIDFMAKNWKKHKSWWSCARILGI